jgi:hypothetical protein
VIDQRWLDRWPVWADEPLGWVIRIVVFLGGIGVGLLFAWFGYFGASFGNDPPVWDAESLILVIFGIVLAVPSVWLSVRPSKAAALTTVMAVAAVFITAWLVR